MKKILITAVVLTLAVPALAAQQDIAQLSAVTASREALRTAINTQLSAVQSNFDEIYAVIDAGPVYANTTAPADTKVVWIDTDQDNAIKVYVGDAWTVVGSGDSYTLPTAAADTLGGVKVGSRLTITDGVLSADVQTTDISGKEDLLGNPSTNGYVLASTTAGVRSWIEMTGGGTGIAHATSDGNYYASKDGGWASLAGVFLNPSGSADLLTITDTGPYFTTDTVGAALNQLGNEIADVTEITLDANTLAITDGVLSVIGGGTGTGGYLATPPTYSDEACTPGQYALSESYRWDCVATGNWNRTALTDWIQPGGIACTGSETFIRGDSVFGDTESFERGVGETCASDWAIALGSGMSTYSSGAANSGTHSLLIADDKTMSAGYIYAGHGTAQTEQYYRFYVKVSSISTYSRVVLGGPHKYRDATSSFAVRVDRPSASSIVLDLMGAENVEIAADEWYRVELKATDADGSATTEKLVLEMRVYNSAGTLLETNTGGGDTTVNSTTTVDQFRFFTLAPSATSEAASEIYIDDIKNCNTWCGGAE